jgi:hypothetical protein
MRCIAPQITPHKNNKNGESVFKTACFDTLEPTHKYIFFSYQARVGSLPNRLHNLRVLLQVDPLI